MPKPDPYAAFCALALSLEEQGIEVKKIIDAAFRLATNAATRMNGSHAVALALHDMAATIVGEEPAPPPTKH
jgi:hypothetical protein